MLHPRSFFFSFRRIPSVHRADQIAGDATNPFNLLFLATRRARGIDRSLEAAVTAPVDGMINRSVADVFGSHEPDDRFDRFRVMGERPVDFDISDMTRVTELMVRCLQPNLVTNRH